jgi:hypothetical protein
VRFLLDENFPLALLKRLREAGLEADHLIPLEQRGIPDAAIRRRLETEPELVFLTQDTEFGDWGFACRGILIVSHVNQGLPIQHRVSIWLRALETLRGQPSEARLFDLLEPGILVPIEVHPTAPIGDD